MHRLLILVVALGLSLTVNAQAVDTPSINVITLFGQYFAAQRIFSYKDGSGSSTSKTALEYLQAVPLAIDLLDSNAIDEIEAIEKEEQFYRPKTELFSYLLLASLLLILVF